MAKYTVKNTAAHREVYLDGKPPVQISLAPGEEREVTLSDDAANELRQRETDIKNHRGIVITAGNVPKAKAKT